jgi:hypothetical protein
VDSRRLGLAFRRLMAGAVDVMVGLVLGVVLSNTPVGFFFASRAVVMLRIGAPDTVWKGPIPMLMGIAGTFVYSLPFAFLLVAMIGPMAGNSPGKALLGIASDPRRDGAVSSRQRWSRAFIGAAPWWGLTAALLTGSWVLALAFAIAAIALLGGALFSIVR